jgi:hypothetical protein
MKNLKWLSLVLTAVFAVGCDPYDDVKSGTPTFLSATAADLVNGVAYGAAATGDTATIDITCADVTANFCPLDPTDPDADQLTDFTTLTDLAVFITFDRQIDGAAVQSTLDDCSPTAGWLSVTPAPAAGEAWYSCYSPSSPSPDEGGSVVVFTAAVPAVAVPPAPQATIAGWGDYSPLPAAPAPIVVSGTVAGRAVSVTVNRVDVTTCACPP